MVYEQSKYPLVHSENLNNHIRSLFLNYQIIKYIKITESIKTLLAYDIKTKKDVIIRITSLERIGNNNIFSLLSILNHKTLPKIYFNQKIQNYHILIQKASEGISLIELKFDMKDALKIFSQIIRLVNYLNTYRIRISELELRHIFVDKNKNVTVSEIDWVELDYKMDYKYEEEQTKQLMNILDYLHQRASNDEYGDRVINIDTRSEKTIKILKTLKSLSQMSNVLGITQDHPVFKDVFVVDPLVLHHIDEMNIQQFDPLLINEKLSKEYFIYRLIDENIVRESFRKQFKEIGCLLNRTKKMLDASRNSLCINEMEDSIFKALYKKEQLKKEIIKRRVEILNEEYPWTFRRYFGCIDDTVNLSVFVLDVERFESKIGNKIKTIDRQDGLKISMMVKRNKIVFNKQKGSTNDFKYLISEFIEEVIHQ